MKPRLQLRRQFRLRVQRAATSPSRGRVLCHDRPTERAQPGGVAGALVAAAERRAVQRTAEFAAEDVVVGETKSSRRL